MNNINGLVMALIMAMLIASCSVNQKVFNLVVPQPAPEPTVNTIVYVYRLNSMANIMVTPKMQIDGRQNIKIENNSYQYVLLSASEEGRESSPVHVFEISVAQRYSGVHKLMLNIKQGDVVFIRLDTSLKSEKNKFYSRSFNLQTVDKKTALNEMQKTHYTGIKQEIEKLGAIKSGATDAGSTEIPASQYSISKTRNPFSQLNKEKDE